MGIRNNYRLLVDSRTTDVSHEELQEMLDIICFYASPKNWNMQVVGDYVVIDNDDRERIENGPVYDDVGGKLARNFVKKKLGEIND